MVTPTGPKASEWEVYKTIAMKHIATGKCYEVIDPQTNKAIKGQALTNYLLKLSSLEQDKMSKIANQKNAKSEDISGTYILKFMFTHNVNKSAQPTADKTARVEQKTINPLPPKIPPRNLAQVLIAKTQQLRPKTIGHILKNFPPHGDQNLSELKKKLDFALEAGAKSADFRQIRKVMNEIDRATLSKKDREAVDLYILKNLTNILSDKIAGTSDIKKFMKIQGVARDIIEIADTIWQHHFPGNHENDTVWKPASELAHTASAIDYPIAARRGKDTSLGEWKDSLSGREYEQTELGKKQWDETVKNIHLSAENLRAMFN